MGNVSCLGSRRASAYYAFSPYPGEVDIVSPVFRSAKLNFNAPPGQKTVVLVSCGSFSPPTVFHLRMMEDARDGLTAQGYHVAGGFLSPVHTAYGKKSLVDMHHRVNMVGLALQDSEWLDVDSWECSQEGYTFTAPVLKTRFQAEIAQLNPEARVMMVCGGDLLESFTAFEKDCRLLVQRRTGVRHRHWLNPAKSAAVTTVNDGSMRTGKDGLSNFVAASGLNPHHLTDGTPVWSAEHQEVILKDCGVACMERDGTDLTKVISKDKMLSQHKSNIAIFKPTVQNNVSSTLVRKLLQSRKSIKYLVHEEVHEYIKMHSLADAPQWQ